MKHNLNKSEKYDNNLFSLLSYNDGAFVRFTRHIPYIAVMWAYNAIFPVLALRIQGNPIFDGMFPLKIR